MKCCLALLSFVIVALLVISASAQNPAQIPSTPPARNPADTPTQLPAESSKPALPVRVGPPPANATAAELEKQADQFRSDKSYADALDYYRAAMKKAPSAALWNKMGITQLQLGRHKEAEKSFERSIKLDPKFPEAYNNLGAVFYITGAQQQIHAERAHKSIPGGALKNYRKAVKQYLKALELHEDAASFHSNLGTAYFALKDFPAAVNEYARALQLDPDVLERRSQSGVTAHMSSPEDRAHYSFVLARMYAQAGNLDRALLYLRKAIEDGYKDIDAVYQDQEFATLRKDPRFTELMNSKPQAIPQ
jgi:tetratricopeptide (TPR) repeat protein